MNRFRQLREKIRASAVKEGRECCLYNIEETAFSAPRSLSLPLCSACHSPAPSRTCLQLEPLAEINLLKSLKKNKQKSLSRAPEKGSRADLSAVIIG